MKRVRKTRNLYKKDAGFVSFEGQEGDSRVRLVVPTERALRYFAEHAKVIQQAAK